MRLHIILSIAMTTLLASGGGLVEAGEAPLAEPPRMLVFTQTLGWRHDSIPEAVATLRELGGTIGVDVVHSEDPSLFDATTLAGFRAVVFANTTGNLLAPGQREAFERYVQGGGSFIGIHAAADTGYDWPWYGELVGAWFDSHPPGLQTTDVHVETGQPPAGRPPPGATWRVTDELYNFRRNPRPWVQVIATVDERGYDGGTMGDDHPIAWCHTRSGGRAWYTGLGHDRALYADARYREHLLRGLRYAARQSAGC